MVDVNRCVEIKILLSYRTVPDLVNTIFSFLPYFVRGWHKKRPTFNHIPLPENPRLLPGSFNPVATFTPYAIVYHSKEELIKMQQIGFTITLFHHFVFKPPYTNLYDKWAKKVGPKAAWQLQLRYSIDPTDVTWEVSQPVLEKYGIDPWKASRERLNSVFVEHAMIESLPNEISEEERKMHPPITLTVKEKPVMQKHLYDEPPDPDENYCATRNPITHNRYQPY